MLGRKAPALVTPRTSLYGREREIAELVALVQTAGERLITLTGVGGCGKTRLALEVALRLTEAFPDGVWLVELAPVSEASGIAHRVASALGMRDASEHGLRTALNKRDLLIVLDNCEHLVEACASLADHLLSASTRLRILATSREPLLIPGERQRRVPPLRGPEPGVRPSPDTLASCPAVQLFVDRARAVAPSFEVAPDNATAIATICTLLDGIPLAIELAAAQVRVLAPNQIAVRLDDCVRVGPGFNRLAPTRQQTLRASLDWSYALLSPPEQVVFRRLAVLAGSWTLEAAEAVCTAEELLQTDVLPLLAGLVDKSLVLADEADGEGRYRLLEPVRQYAAQRLLASGELASTQARQARYCILLAERAERDLAGPRQREWLRRLDSELDNIRAAMARAEQIQDAATMLAIAGPLYYFLWLRRHLHEGRHWFEVGLASPDAVPPELRARGLFGLTLMLSLVGQNAQAEVVGQQAINAYRESGNSGALALVQVVLAQTSLARSDLQRARHLAEDAVAHARAADAAWALGHALILLGQVLHRRGESARATALYEQALALFEEQGDSWSRAYALASITSLHQPSSSVTRVAAIAGVRWSWETGDDRALASALEYLALYGGPQATDAQIGLFAAAHALRQLARVSAPPGERDDVERQLTRARAELGEAAFEKAWTAGLAAQLEQVVKRALRSPAAGAQGGTRGGRGEALTPREREVALLLIQGATDKEIAQALTISEGTAGLHVHHVLAKLRLRSRVQVAERAVAAGLIEAVSTNDPEPSATGKI